MTFVIIVPSSFLIVAGAHHFLQHQGANLAFVCIAKGQYHCLVHEIPPIKRTPMMFFPVYRRKNLAPVTSPRWRGLFSFHGVRRCHVDRGLQGWEHVVVPHLMGRMR